MRNAIRVMEPDDIKAKMEHLDYRFPMRSAQTLEAEVAQIKACVDRGLPRLRVQPLRTETLCVVGYGPSLKGTWREIAHPCISMSGSHDFLVDRGIVPDYHAQTDGRDHQVAFLQRPQPATTYLMATISPPAVWDLLKGHRVLVWHNLHGQHVIDWVGQHDRGGLIVAGGSNIGLASIHLGGILGFRRFRLFGFDGNRRASGGRHAGPHPDPDPQRELWRWAEGRPWPTSPQMSNACDELVRLVTREAGIIEIEVEGDSLQAALLRESRVGAAFWRDTMAEAKPSWTAEVHAQHVAAEALRARANYNTGSITESASLHLRCLVARYRPEVAVEIGTFIGNSAAAIASVANRVYTCDRDNDCLDQTQRIKTFPRSGSIEMLGKLADAGCLADLFFFDGRIQAQDVPLILRLSRPSTVYAFDDYEGAQKGVVNVDLLRPFLPRHAFIPPPQGTSERVTIAALVPRGASWP